MHKSLRIIIIAIGACVVVWLLLMLVVPRFLDPNAYKRQVSALVKARTGHDLIISGDIKLAVFPWIALEVGPVQLSSAPGFGATPLFQARHASVRIKLLPLLSKQVQMDNIRLDGVEIHLVRDAAGRGNWRGLDATASKPTGSGAAHEGGSASALAVLAVGGIELHNAGLEWDDKRSGSFYHLSDITFVTGRFVPGKPFDVDLEFGIVAGHDSPLRQVKLTGKATADPAVQRYQLRKLNLEIGLPGGGKAELVSDLDIDLARQLLDMPAIELHAEALAMTGHLQASRILDKPDVQGEFQLAEFNPRNAMQAFGAQVPKTADPTVLTKASATFSLRAEGESVTLKPLSVHLDDSALSGEFSIRDFSSPALGFTLAVDKVNLDRYLPPAPERSAGGSGPAPAVEAPWPLDALRSLNLEGDLQIGRLQAYRLQSTDVRVTVKAHGGLVSVQPASALLYDGHYQGDVQIDVRGTVPRLSMAESLQEVQVGDLLKDLQGTARLSGRGNLAARLQSSGRDPATLRRNLNGTADFAFRDGAIRGFNLASKIRAAKAVLKGQAVPADNTPNQTDFSELTGTAIVTNGVVKSDDLLGKSPFFRVSGAGRAVLAEQTLDYLLKVVIVRDSSGQGGAGLDELRGITVPVRISGAFSDLNYAVDLKAALGDVAKARLEEKKQAIEQKLQDKLQNKLKGLFH